MLKYNKIVCRILENKRCNVKEQLKRFNLNGFTSGFYPQSQKVEVY